MGSIAELCSSAIFLNRGAVLRAGPVPEVVEAYLSLLNADRGAQGFEAWDDKDCAILSADVLTSAGKSSRVFDLADRIVVELRYRLKRDLVGFQVSLSVVRNLVEVFRSFDTDGAEPVLDRMRGDYVCRHEIPAHFLKAGGYSIGISVGTPERHMIDAEHVLGFEIEELSENTHHRGYRSARPGQVISPGVWSTERIESPDSVA
jgi:lipopolysaccharide transport system ATP-binding protein